jgi:alkylation response protein AidB-like acyl-CoA dehydrogenase
MQFELVLSDADRAFQAEVRAFLDANLPKGWGTPGFRAWRNEEEQIAFLRDWQYRLYKAGLAAIAWPEEWGGRNATLIQQLIFNQEMQRRAAPEILNRGAILRGGPILMQWGTEWQKQRFLPKMLSGEEFWCQTFSEPDAGSDLAALRTRAELDGDDYVINGHKIWTTRAQYADWSFLLARTDPNAPKHHGISYFLLNMKSPGVIVRPLKQISGRSEFNEVLLQDVRIPRAYLVGEPNKGWQVATNFLNFERASLGDTTRLEKRLRIVTRLAKETIVDGQRKFDDPLVQDELARFATLAEALRLIGQRTILAGLRGTPGPESAVAKLLTTETDQQMANFGLDLLGPAGILERGSPRALKEGNAALSYLIMRAATIGGGTSEIQRNLIGERILGLPRD